MSLGDYAAAVGHLLASTPDTSARYYRDALTTLALASAAAATDAATTTPGLSQLRTQAAKVITANAASVGDSALGVPLLCSIGTTGCFNVAIDFFVPQPFFSLKPFFSPPLFLCVLNRFLFALASVCDWLPLHCPYPSTPPLP